MTWPAQSSDLSVIENVRRTIKLKLQSETDMVKSQNARKVERSLQDLKVAAFWICYKSVCIYSKSTGFPNSRKIMSVCPIDYSKSND